MHVYLLGWALGWVLGVSIAGYLIVTGRTDKAFSWMDWIYDRVVGAFNRVRGWTTKGRDD